MSRYGLSLKRWFLSYRDFSRPFNELIAQPLPAGKTCFRDAEIVSLDIETTGLDAGTADILSVGWVVIRGGKVDLSTAESHIVRPRGAVGGSAAIHGLTDTAVQSGVDWTVALGKIIVVLTGRALLVHHAGLDKALLDRLCKQQFGAPLLVPVIDTLALENRRQRRRHHVEANQSLRLADIRDRYRLPRYAAHDCLVDAIATAELLMAMLAHNDGAERTSLGDLYS